MTAEAIETFPDTSTLAYASAVDLQGLIDMDLNNPVLALASFQKALDIRQTLTSTEDPLVASSINNIALAHTEMGNLGDAYESHQRALEIRLKFQPNRVENTYSNLSSLFLRMGKADEAEEWMKKCPSLKEFTDEAFIKTGNPRFSGNMVLLSRIRLQQNRLDDALRLASKALTFRQKLLGERLKVCDSLYDVAKLMHKQGNIASAV